MPEIRFKISEKLDKNLSKICERLGIDRADYIKMLIVNDLRKEGEDVSSDEKTAKKKEK